MIQTIKAILCVLGFPLTMAALYLLEVATGVVA